MIGNLEYGQKVKIKDPHSFYNGIKCFVIGKEERKVVSGPILVKYLVQTDDGFEMREWVLSDRLEKL